MPKILNKNILYIIFIIIVIILIILIIINKTKYQNKQLNIYFFNAGKADSILIYNNKFSVLIDTGEKNLGSTILNYLNKHNIKKLDYLIITHFDKDHVGSASKIIKNIKINKVIQSNYPKESNVYNEYLDALKDKSINPITLKEILTFSYGDITFQIDPPKEEEYIEKPSNNSSLITSIYYKDTSYLFMGDSENLRITEFLEYNNQKYDFIKIPYHGHYQTKLEDLIKNTKPKYAVITSSIDELEDTKTLEILDKYNVKTYLTRNNDILLTSDGLNINITT